MKLKGLLIPANGKCSRIEIDNTLEALQKVVGGYIETVTFAIDRVLIVNEEGRIIGLPDNEHLGGIVGDALMVGVNGDEFCSLGEQEIEALRRLMK